MTLPVNARVEAAPNFLSNLDAAHEFFLEQDTDSAAERFRKLKATLREMVAEQWQTRPFPDGTFRAGTPEG